jgi:hypothetical protein
MSLLVVAGPFCPVQALVPTAQHPRTLRDVALVSVAVCPHPPLLVPEVAAGAAPELDDLRAACDTAVTRMLSRCDGVRLVAARHGLPSAVDIGRWLLARNGSEHPLVVDVVDDERTTTTRPSEVGLLVMADGSARRTPKAPGALHPEAQAFDREIAELLMTGREPDLSRATEMWCTDAAAFTALLAATRGVRWQRELLHEEAPYGVAYFVASWARADG